MENYTPVFRYPLTESDGWKKLSGELPVRMTNDYLFRALLQSDNEVLKAILASVLHMDIRDICSARVTNPILLGEHIDSRTYILDVSIVLNDRTNIDLEMQVVKETWWACRSLLYVCRSYDRLNRGSAYINVKPVRQIAFCDFTLFEDSPEFYADYKLINSKKLDVIYTDNFIISNIDLTRIDLATEEDRKYGVDNWALFFKAKTWEEMRMLAEKDANLERAISGMWQLTEEEMIREQCRAREEWIINDNWKNETIEQQKRAIEEQKQAIEEYEINDKWKNETIEQQKKAIEEFEINDKWKNETIEQQKQAIEEYEINDKWKNETIEQQKKAIAALESANKEQGEEIRLLKEDIALLKEKLLPDDAEENPVARSLC